MAKYILLDALVAMIEKIYNEGYKFLPSDIAENIQNFKDDVLINIDTLEVKEINNVWHDASDFPKAEAGRSILFIEDNGYTGLLKSPSAERLFYFQPTNLKMWAYVDELISMTTHFKVKETDLEKEIKLWFDYGLPNNEELLEYIKETAEHFFELGAKTKGE